MIPRGVFSASDPPASLVEALRRRAEAQPDAMACRHLGEREEVLAEASFGDLDRQSQAIAARLQGLGAAGECVILLYPSGLDFIRALFGCLYANAIAVPLPIPRLKAAAALFVALVEELKARVLLTTATSLARIGRLDLSVLESLVCLTTDDTAPELARAWRRPAAPATVAYLQYTSGSTSRRKGVAITHAGALANLLAISERFRHHDASVSVSWLPHTHDLGLVGGILQPICHGHPNVLISPAAFVQQPILWLNAISRYRGTYSHSPNFGYDLCVRRTTPAQRAALDLSSWEVALNGAEPVRVKTIQQFADAFRPCGFRPEAMFPAYGLAEATLMVSGGPRDRRPRWISVDATALQQGLVVATDREPARQLVGCGEPLAGTAIAIVDPVTGTVRPDGQLGEIWVSGSGVAPGYWPAETGAADTFRARIADQDAYLRTGDLGFVHEREVYIAGRLKDVIIVRGANHYPQDIEWTVEESHPAFRRGCGAAFSVDVDGQEQLAVVFEIERDQLRSVSGDALTRIARRAVAEAHDLQLHTLVLLKTGGIPRTTSGKVQRQQCRADLLAGMLPELFSAVGFEVKATVSESSEEAVDSAAIGEAAAAADLCEWLRAYAEDRLNSRLMDERRSIAPHVVLDFGNRGILGLQVPRDAGGLGLGYRAALKVVQQLGAIDQTLAMMAIVQNSLGIRPILRHAEEALKSDLVPRLASGRELAAFAITEPAAGSNPQAIVATARPDGTDAWRLHGQKSWSGSAGWATVINVFVQNVDPDGCVRGLSGFVVRRDCPGLTVGPEAMTLGMRAMVQNTLYLEGARVSRGQSLGGIGGGMAVAQDAMMDGRLAIAAACVGGMKRCLQILIRYAGRRSISTGRLLENPVLIERAGTLSAAVAAIESLVTHVAERLDRDLPVPVDAHIICKAAGSEWFCQCADDLVQFLGGRGYIESNIAPQLWRDARVTRILEGPTEALTMFLGSRVVNDNAGIRALIAEDLQAPGVSAELAVLAEEILHRCVSGRTRFGDAAAARRWAYALIGQLATDAALRAALPRDAPAHCRAWADDRFQASVARARAQSGADGFRLDGGGLAAIVDSYAAAIGDIQQSLAGEDSELDAMLRRDPDARATIPPIVGAAMPGDPTVPLAPAEDTTPARADVAAIERFIVERLGSELKLPGTSIDPTRSCFEYGMDSVTAVTLVVNLEEWLGLDLNPELVYDIPVIRRLAAHLASLQRTRT